MVKEGNNVSKTSSIGARIAALLFSAVFALGFGLGGYYAGLQPLAHTLQTALQVRSWHPVQAQILSVQLETHQGRNSATYEVRALYRYQVAGKAYESTRVGLDARGNNDNIDDWHREWAGRLQSAQARGQGITVLVNPQHPSQSLIDPSIRWYLQLFRIPFALVFSLVGLVAAWFFLHTLRGLAGADGALPEDGSSGLRPGASPTNLLKKSSSSTSVGAVWFFTIFWCGIACPMAALIWTSSGTPGLAKAFIFLFVVIGLGLMVLSLRQTHMAWRYGGAALTAFPALPRAGHPVEMSLLLPARAAANQQGRQLQLRLAQYRVDESSSGSPERCVESFSKSAHVQPTADGGLRLTARFDLPLDAPPHGAPRSGERVDWRLELLRTPGGVVELTYDMPVQAAPQAEQADDRFDRRAAWKKVTPIALVDAPSTEGKEGVSGEGALLLPAAVALQETPHAWQFEFSQRGWRWAAGLVLIGLVAEAVLNGRFGPGGIALPQLFIAACVWWLLGAFVLQAATCRWTLSVRDEGITVRRQSALWSRAKALPGQASLSLVYKLLYSTRSGASENPYYAVYARGGDGTLVRITPGLSGEGAATAVGQSIAQAWSHRRGHFSPGAQRPARAGHSRPAWGLLLLAAALAWWIWGPSVAGLVRPPTSRHPAASVAAAPPADSYAAVDDSLLDAQDAGDAKALGAALAAGANPNLLVPSGSSVLMLAAHRGQLEHIELLLRAGAQPDLRQTHKDSERGDTALLRAFYGGHLAAAQRLVQAGASLAGRNRWDWGPVHMAAQSGCVPCLQWLAERGQPLDEPALASRGETPAMLAAAKGHVKALEWLDARGVDLWRKDPHDKTALDWARFGRQREAERWLMERLR